LAFGGIGIISDPSEGTNECDSLLEGVDKVSFLGVASGKESKSEGRCCDSVCSQRERAVSDGLDKLSFHCSRVVTVSRTGDSETEAEWV